MATSTTKWTQLQIPTHIQRAHRIEAVRRGRSLAEQYVHALGEFAREHLAGDLIVETDPDNGAVRIGTQGEE